MNDNQRDIIYNCICILFNLNHTIKLFESIGVNIEDGISNNNIGNDIYGAMSNTYTILENVVKNMCGTTKYVPDVIENLYAYDGDTTVSKENAINSTMLLFSDMAKSAVEGTLDIED